MRKAGDIILAFGIVAMLAVIAEGVLKWRLLPNAFIQLLFFIGGLLLILFGIIIRNIGKKNENKSNT